MNYPIIKEGSKCSVVIDIWKAQFPVRVVHILDDDGDIHFREEEVPRVSTRTMFIIPDEPVPFQSSNSVKGITAIVFALVVIYHIDSLRDTRNIFQIGITIRNINNNDTFPTEFLFQLLNAVIHTVSTGGAHWNELDIATTQSMFLNKFVEAPRGKKPV
jgi:hypothetical protein